MCQQKLGIKNKQLPSLVGGCLVKFSTAVISTWGNINLYILSHFLHQGTRVTETTNPFILLLTVIPMIFATLAATKLCNKYSHEKVIKVCSFIFFFSPLVSAIFFKFQIFVFFSVIVPASSFAIIAIPVLNTMWGLFPQSRNKMTALLVISFGVGSLFWNMFFMHLMNPDNKSTTVKEGDMSFFDQEVTNNVHRTAIIGFLMSGVLTVIGSFLIKRKVLGETEIQLNEQGKNDLGSEKQNMENNNPTEIIKSDDEMIAKIPKNPEVKESLKDPRFIIIFLISFLICLYEVHLGMNLKIIFMPIVHDDHFLGYVSMLCNGISIGGAFFWGMLGDRRGVAFSLLCLAIADFIIKLYSNFALTKPTIVVMMVLIGTLSKAVSTLAGPGFVEYFGLQIGTQLLPYKGVAILVGFIIVPLFQVITASFWTPHDYLVALSAFSIVTLILAIRLYRIGKKDHARNQNP